MLSPDSAGTGSGAPGPRRFYHRARGNAGIRGTSFTFDEFQMDQPYVSVVLGVDNEIRLELEFTATVDGQSTS